MTDFGQSFPMALVEAVLIGSMLMPALVAIWTATLKFLTLFLRHACRALAYIARELVEHFLYGLMTAGLLSLASNFLQG